MAAGAAVGLPPFLQQATAALALDESRGKEKHPNRILVVVELFGGNDGLNTIVPYRNDDYYKNRSKVGIPADKVIKINDEIGFHPKMNGFEKLYKDGKLAIIQGVSYPNATRSHFRGIEFMRSALPNQVDGDGYGWVGRFADAYQPKREQLDFIVNIAEQQSLAVTGRVHAPIVFYQADAFKREGASVEDRAYDQIVARKGKETANQRLDYLRSISSGTKQIADSVRTAVGNYSTTVDYGYENAKTSTVFGAPSATLAVDLKKVAACISGGLKTRVYYVKFEGGWDTHFTQGSVEGQHASLVQYTADSLAGFQQDIERLGRGADVTVLVLTEFGRRLKENKSGGTDHGMSGPWFLTGKTIKGGIYFDYPSLTDLDQGDLKMRVDFRSVYATVIKKWLGYDDTRTILKGEFPTLDVVT